MADACNARQRNLYERASTRHIKEYMDGKGDTYEEQIRKMSWPICTDVPAIGQYSGTIQIPELKKYKGFSDGLHSLHPMTYTKLHHTDHLAFCNTVDGVGVGKLADPSKDVYTRLYLGSKSQAHQPARTGTSRLEIAGDIAFKNGEAAEAHRLYTKALQDNPSMFTYEKRCAAYAECGLYEHALRDAEHLLKHAGPHNWGSASARVKALKDFLRRQNNYDPGYHQATTTLVCLLRPREHKQIMPSTPSNYGRPHTALTIGEGLSSATSMAALGGWDKDGDGNIDLDELHKGLATLGYKPKKKERSVFKGQGSLIGQA